MKALVYTDTLEMQFRDEPQPKPGNSEALVKIQASGICGSDMHAYHGLDARRVPPLILGHEAVGVVQNGQFEGESMAINPLISCAECNDCINGRSNLCQERELIGMRLAGAFANYVVVPERNLIAIPPALKATHASLMEPTAVSLHAVILAEKILHRPLSECRSLVIGGGAIGLLAALILSQKGSHEIHLAETNSARRETLDRVRCAQIFDPTSDSTPEPNSFELVIDAVGSGTTRAASSHYVRPGGVISHIGLQDDKSGLDTRKITLQEITFIGNYTYTPADLRASLNALAGGELGSLDWVEERPLSSGACAFRDIHEGRAEAPKIVLLP